MGECGSTYLFGAAAHCDTIRSVLARNISQRGKLGNGRYIGPYGAKRMGELECAAGVPGIQDDRAIGGPAGLSK